MPLQSSTVIDCDVHCAPATWEPLWPSLDDYWRDYIEEAGVRLAPWFAIPVSYPPNAPTSARAVARESDGPAVPATYEQLAQRVLGADGPSHAILNCLAMFDAYRNPYYQAALSSALNTWLRTEFLDHDPRLRASIVVPWSNVDGAVAEIERLSGDHRFVQVLTPVRSDFPLGNRIYHPILAAAAEHDLAIGLHAWGQPHHAPTPSGFTTTYMEDYLSNPAIVQQHILSLVAEGAFVRFPTLRVSLMECGFAWLPSLLWRLDKDWKGIVREVPWVKEPPSVYVRRHFRATTSPAHLGSATPSEIKQIVDMVGVESLLYASDYPHDHGHSGDALVAALDADARDAVLGGNARTFYGLGADSVRSAGPRISSSLRT
jgi:predicted TIM-barrel fold metal-dependent hydrolase